MPVPVSVKRITALLALSLFLFLLGNGILGLTNPDEVFYAQTAKEMIQRHSWMTPYLFGHPQFEKPILLFWFLRVAFALFGACAFGARFFPGVFAAMGVLFVYFIGLTGFKEERKAFLAAIILGSSLLYIGLAKTVFTDMVFSIWILFSLVSFFWGYTCRKKKNKGLILFFIFAALAVLTKGPLGAFIPFLTVFLFLSFEKNIKFLFCGYFFAGIFVFLLISLPWYIFMIKQYGHNFTHEFFYNDHIRRIMEAEHPNNDSWYFYPLSMIGSMIPWALFLVSALISLPRRLMQNARPLDLFLVSWISSVFVIFQIAHSKLISYILPLVPALALITADFIHNNLPNGRGNFLFRFSAWGTSAVIISLPFCLIIGTAIYPGYVHSEIPVYLSALSFLILAVVIASFIRRNVLLKGIYAIALTIPFFMFAIPFIHGDIEPYLSSKAACEYLLENYEVNNTILCSKFFVRGVTYYTDKDTAVLKIPGKPFFSPHPVPFLDTDQKVRGLFSRQPVTYCVFTKASVDGMDRIVKNDFRYTILKKFGDEYVVRVGRF